MTIRLIFLSFGLLLSVAAMPQFTNVAGAVGLDLGTAKDGGMSWADLNEDGCLDLIVNTNNNTQDTKIYFSDCNLPNPTFTDVTATHCDGCNDNKTERSVAIGDLNHDGYMDFARNTSNRIEIYGNRGPSAVPPYSFGDINQDPDIVFTALAGGLNSEGMAFLDYNQDGWLDLLIDNHNYGIDMMENPADCSLNMFHNTPNGNTLGLPTGATDGDYMATGDFNDDGYMDMICRKRNESDLFKGGAGVFVDLGNIDQATNANKGAVSLCDFDNDGDLDIFWTAQGVTQIWKQTGLNSENFVATGEPAASAGITFGAGIDGCGCGDIDNDGDMDLFAIDDAGASYLFYNNSTGTALDFTRNNNGINVNGDGEGMSLFDYDNDGDLDVYINRNNAGNQLWRNPTNDNNYLYVEPLLDLELGVTRVDHNATVILKDATNTTILGGIKCPRAATGHGSQEDSKVHFGLPNGPNALYHVIIKFGYIGGTRVVLDTLITPALLPNQTLKVVNDDFGALPYIGCTALFLPVELLEFTGIQDDIDVALNWTTASESENEYFYLEHSRDGIFYDLIANIPAAGTSHTATDYEFSHKDAVEGVNYYRLIQQDLNGEIELLETIAVDFELESLNLVVYPNPIVDDLRPISVRLTGVSNERSIQLEVRSSDGRIIQSHLIDVESNSLNYSLDRELWRKKGIYFISVILNDMRLTRKVIVR